MKLFSFTHNGITQIGFHFEDKLINLSSALHIFQQAQGTKRPLDISFLQVFVEMGYCQGSMLEQIISNPWVQAKLQSLQLTEPLHYELPIQRPSKIVCLGRNYRKHAAELKHDIPKEPLFFCKAPSSLLPHEGEIVIPEWLTDRVDHEAELGIIIGKEGKDIPEKEAMDYVAGFTIVNDVTARTMQKADISKGNPWFRSKSLDTFCPLGPYIVPADIIRDPQNLEIELTVNGETRQKANTKDMLFPVPVIISHISRYMTLNAGDIIATGTPEGVSPINRGDMVQVTISDLGTLKNSVV